MLYIVGIIIGLLLGLTGAGGSVFAVPLLILLIGLPASQAMGIALGAVAFSALYGVLQQRSLVFWLPGVILAFGGMLTAPVGRVLAGHIDDAILLLGFNLLAITIAIRMWQQASSKPEATHFVRAGQPTTVERSQVLLCRLSSNGFFQLKPRCISGLFAGGLAIGLLSGLFGVGGGFLIVPFLLFLSQIQMQAAVATSLFTIVLVSLSGFIAHTLFAEPLNLAMLGQIIVAGVLGMFISQFISDRLAGPILQKTFSVLLVSIALITLVLF